MGAGRGGWGRYTGQTASVFGKFLDTNYYLTQGVGPFAKRCGFWNKLEPKLQTSQSCQVSRGARNSSIGGFYQQNSCFNSHYRIDILFITCLFSIYLVTLK